MTINFKTAKAEIDESLKRADAVANARRLAGMYVTQPSEGEDETPERILMEVGTMQPADMLARYNAYMAAYSTLPIDPEGDKVRIYHGEWSIWSGFPGQGKTTFIRQMCCKFLKHMNDGECVFIATLEQDPEWYLIEMAATAAGVETPSEAQLTSFLDTFGPKLKLWSVIGNNIEHRKILATIRDLAKNHGCRHAVIDSLMTLDIDSKDIEAQRQFANLVSASARATGVHIHLVAHPKKPIAADQSPQVWDVAGSSDLGRLAFNVFFVRRGDVVPGFDNIGQMRFEVLKQRTRGIIGEQLGYFYRKQRQFHLDQYATEPTRYLPENQYPASGMTEEIPEHLMNPGAFKVEPSPVTAPWET